MKKISKKKLLLLPIIAIFGILLCIINVKNDTFTTLTSSIRHFFEGNDQELIEEKAKESGFEDVNLYTSVIDSYNLFKEDINIIPPTDKVRGEMTYLGGFSREVNVENDIVSFTDGEVKFYEADETVGRMSAANRVGLKITAPETLTYEEYKNAKIIRINTYEDKTQINEMIFDNVKDSETYYETWPVVTSTLKQVTILINWTGTDYQVFTMYFNNVTLEKNEEPTPSVTQDKVRGEMSYLGGFSREVNVENDIVSFTDGEVKFYEADETVGRMSAANRVGLKITAPETLTYEEYKNAKIIRINTYEDKTQINEMIFDNVKDSETYYETWPVVTSTLKQVTILINWAGTDYQAFTMNFNNVTLEKNPNAKISYKDGITSSQMTEIINLDASNKNISSSKGVEQLTNLESLDLSNNNLEYIDLTLNEKLTNINLSNNNFTKNVILYNDMIFDATKYSNIVKLPQSLKVEELSTKEEDNKYILNYGIPATESIPEQPLYEITYNINYYEYITDKYILNSPNTTIYTINKDFYLDEENPDTIEQILDNGAILRNENNNLNIYDNENNIIKSFTISKIESSLYDLNKSYIYENNINKIIESINYPDNLELSTYNNILTIKEINSDQELINIPILNISSTDYDITENYIFTGIEELNIEKLIKSNEEINLSIEDNNLVISYDTEELSRLPVKNITSNTYDLTDHYINDGNFDLSLINYDKDLISTNLSDDNILTFNYKENVYTYYLVNINIPYVTKEVDNKKVLYTKFNENFDFEKIITENASKEIENNILTIKYGDKEETYTIVEPKYEISTSYKIGENYIYTGTDKEAKEVTVSNGTKKIENNTLILTSDSGEEVTYSLYSISSDKYDLNKEYIYVGTEDFNQNEITKTDELTFKNENNILEIMLNNEVVDSYKIITLSIDNYKVDDKKIYIGFNNFDLNSITITNAEKNIIDNSKLEIKYNNEILDIYEIKQAQLSSNKYNLKEEYIYTKFEKFDKSAIVVENALDYSIDLNGLNQLIINCDNSIKKYDIISLSIPENSNISTKDTIIYTINNKVDDNTISKNLISSNSKLKVEENSIKVQYNNLYLDEIPFTQITIDEKYDLTKDYIYENNIENIKNAITPVENINITNNTLSVKIANVEVLNKKILSINSTDYDITENYIFTGTEDLNLEKITKSYKDINLSIEDNNLHISYNTENLDRLPIKNITSNKYDLKNNYINDNNFILSEINYDKDLISANISKDNVLTFNYKTKSYNYYLVSIEIPYITKEENNKKILYTKFNEQFNINNIKITNATPTLNKNILTIKYGDKIESYTIIEPKYEIPYDYDNSYIYTETDTEASKVKVSHGTKKIEDGILTLTSEVGEKVIYPLYSISSSKYDLNKDYIYVGRDDFKESDIKTSQDNMISISNNEIHINVNNKTKKTYRLIKLTINKYKVEDKNIYTGLDNLDITNIVPTNNAKPEFNNSKLLIKYNNEVLDTYTIITTKISSSKYDLSKDYIYTGTNKFDEKNIIIENGDKKIDTKKNTITISNQKLGILKTYNIVTINKIPDHSAGYIYTDTNLLNVNDRDIVNVANATANIIDNNLVILKDNDELLRIPIISITSKIDLGKGYIYGLTDDNISSNVKVSNGKVEIAETKDTKKLIVKDLSGKILKEVNIPKITFNKNIDVKGKVIMIKEKIDYKDFIKNVSCKSCQIEIKNNKETISNGIIEHQMKLNVMYNSTILDAYTFSVDYLEMNSISYDEKYIYGFRHGSKMGDLISNISTSGKIKVTTPEGKELTSNDSLATGEKVTITLNDGNVINYIVVVKGDVLGHATVSVGDVGTLFLHLRKINNVEECYEKAGDVLNPGNGITIGDVSTIFLYIRGIINNLEE